MNKAEGIVTGIKHDMKSKNGKIFGIMRLQDEITGEELKLYDWSELTTVIKQGEHAVVSYEPGEFPRIKNVEFVHQADLQSGDSNTPSQESTGTPSRTNGNLANSKIYLAMKLAAEMSPWTGTIKEKINCFTTLTNEAVLLFEQYEGK